LRVSPGYWRFLFVKDMELNLFLTACLTREVKYRHVFIIRGGKYEN